MLNIILFGPPGSGKGTQAINIAEKYNLVHISTGDLLRNELKEGTPLGLEAKKFIDAGMLVPDEVVIGMISGKLDDHLGGDNKGFIFDGFPRTTAQAEALDKLLDFKNTSITCVLALDVSKEEITQRILERGKISGRSDDQSVETIHLRYSEYLNKTSPVADYYGAKDLLVKIHGEGSIDDIFDDLCSIIDNV